MPTYLINQSDWAGYIHLPDSISTTIYANTIAPHVNKAQEVDLESILHKDFWAEVYEVAGSGVDSANGNLTKVNYDLLLPYLKPIIIHFAYARYMGRAEVVNTRYGAVQKTNTHSEPIPEPKVRRLQYEDKELAMKYVHKMEDFIEDNLSSFPTWNKNRWGNGSKRTGLTIWSV